MGAVCTATAVTARTPPLMLYFTVYKPPRNADEGYADDNYNRNIQRTHFLLLIFFFAPFENLYNIEFADIP